MDYGKLKKDELLSLCEERGIAYTSSWTKQKLEEILIEAENNPSQNVKVHLTSPNNEIGKIGAIINIVFASICLVVSIFLSFLIIGIPLLIGAICTIVSNKRYMNGKDNKIMAGVLGILFAGLIGGIFVLCGSDNKQ